MNTNVSQISSVYTHTSDKHDNVDTLPAAEWNELSTAVAEAHTKINDILSGKKGEISGAGGIKLISTTDDVNGEGDITLSAQNEIYINADQTIKLKANTISIGDSDSPQAYATSVYGDFTVAIPAENDTTHTVKAEDLYTIIAYFKNEGRTNGTGPFASPHSNSQS